MTLSTQMVSMLCLTLYFNNCPIRELAEIKESRIWLGLIAIYIKFCALTLRAKNKHTRTKAVL